jgi:hypothetical protein
MSMTQRDRMLAVYRGETPDQVPFFLDVSHWFYQKHHLPFDLSASITEPEWPLIEYHKKMQVGFYIPNLVSYVTSSYEGEVRSSATKELTPEGPEITWRLETPVGAIQRKRRWEERSYSWNVSHWGISTAQDLRVLGYALGRLRYAPAFERYHQWRTALGELGVPYMSIGYSAMGHLLSYWMGIEKVIYASVDIPDVLHEAVDQINAAILAGVDLLCSGPADVILLGDNFSSDVQSPRFFKEWSEPFYREAFRRIRAAGKHSAVHVDGRQRGLLRAMRDAGADCIDALTPAPMFDLTPEQCRDEAGPDLILSGGVPPNVWMPEASDEDFRGAVLAWLDIRRRSPRLIAAAGDQVPPGSPEYRIEMMRELVEKHGNY